VLWASGRLYLYKALVYNYVNIDDLNLFPYREVKAGSARPWPVGSDYNRAKLSPLLQETLEKYRSVAFLVIQHDSIRYEQYWDNYGPSSLSNSFSMAKSFISILTGIAIDEGRIRSMDDPVCAYLPEFCKGMDSTLTIRHLLMMSSGLNYDEGYASLFGPVTRSYYGTDLRGQMYDLDVIRTPGREFNYMSSNTQLLAFVLEKATGMKVSNYASEKLWKPIHAEHDAMWSLDHRDGDEKAYCCFYSNARDFARIGKLFLNKGRWDGNQVVSEAYVTSCVTPAPVTDNGLPNKIYGYQWWLTEQSGRKVFYARGILGQYIFVIPDLDLVAVRLGHERGEKGPDGQLLDVPVYLSEIIHLYGGK
jgi:CubicO group peptidase (beta-lactamase class C family)